MALTELAAATNEALNAPQASGDSRVSAPSALACPRSTAWSLHQLPKVYICPAMKWGSPHFRVKFEIPPVLRDSTEIGLATPSLIASPAFWMALSVCILEVDA